MATWSEPTATHPITRKTQPMRRTITIIAATIALAGGGTGVTLATAQDTTPTGPTVEQLQAELTDLQARYDAVHDDAEFYKYTLERELENHRAHAELLQSRVDQTRRRLAYERNVNRRYHARVIKTIRLLRVALNQTSCIIWTGQR